MGLQKEKLDKSKGFKGTWKYNKVGGTSYSNWKKDKGFGYKMSEFPNRKAFIVLADGFYCDGDVDVVEGVDNDDPKWRMVMMLVFLVD
ncbi:hypothetical protein HAX54_047943 [Datura stramonium]|uniref:Uncharacterized protein n=1 Tax=Datura stramonium TaxID=4076 RepID=A0ABS8STM9_DATST|nr:hypothetical protein [Datura stramonium]